MEEVENSNHVCLTPESRPFAAGFACLFPLLPLPAAAELERREGVIGTLGYHCAENMLNGLIKKQMS